MLVDPLGRKITYLRISVTDKCNFRCTYCMPKEGVALKPHSEMMSYEEIAALVKEAVSLGISKIKLTGGEPLVKRNIETLVKLISSIPGIDDLGMTTNGSLLTRDKARALKEAGLMRVNISLDTLCAEKFKLLTRGADINYTLRGIDAAIAGKLTPVKINMILFPDTDKLDVEKMQQFCDKSGLKLQTIAHFSLDNRTQNYQHSADKPPRCNECNRLRLTADGHLKPCLFYDKEIKVSLINPRASIMAAVELKPSKGFSCSNRMMSQIGG